MRIYAGCLTLAAAVSGLAFAEQAGLAPIEISPASPALAAGSNENVLFLSNRSSKKIRGYVLVIEYPGQTGGPAMRITETRLSGLEPPPARDGFAPHEQWKHGIRGAGPLGPSARITVDYVLFADRSSWGPDSLHQSERLAGVDEGWRLATAHLKRLLEESGAQAVTEYLKRAP